MFKKTTVVFCAALAYSQAFAGGESVVNSYTQKNGIEDLKGQASILKQEVETRESRYLLSTLQRDGAKLLGKMSGSHFALDILKQRNLYEDQSFVFGGHLQTNLQYWHGSKIDIKANNAKTSYQSGKALNTSSVSFYNVANLNRYFTGALTVSANSSPNLNIKNAFVILGNLDDYPVYATLGKNRVTFGSFSGGGTSTGSLAQMLFQPGNVPNISLSHYDCGLSTNLSFFQTDEHRVDFSFASLYKGEKNDIKYSVGAGYVYDINGTGQKSFDKAQTIEQRIGAVNFDTSISYDIFSLSSGYTQTTNKWSETNGGYAGAWHFQGSMSPCILGQTLDFNLSYHGAYNTSKIPLNLIGSTTGNYIPKDTSINKMVIASARVPLLTENISLNAEYNYARMYNDQSSHTYTCGISAYF